MWAGLCGSSGAGDRDRGRESVSLGGDTHKWIKRALFLYKHIKLMFNAQRLHTVMFVLMLSTRG